MASLSEQSFINLFFSKLGDSDIKICIDDAVFDVHRSILKLHSPVFESLLSVETDSLILVHDSKIFSKLIDVLYMQDDNLTLIEIVELLKLTNFYDMKDVHHNLLLKLLDYLTLDNVYEIYSQMESEISRAWCAVKLVRFMVESIDSADALLETITEEVDMMYFCELISTCHRENENLTEIKFLKLMLKWREYHNKEISNLVTLIEPYNFTTVELFEEVIPHGLFDKATLLDVVSERFNKMFYSGKDYDDKKIKYVTCQKGTVKLRAKKHEMKIKGDFVVVPNC